MTKDKLNKSFLKWAGGKKQSIQLISDTIGSVKGTLIEPFIGSGVVSLNIEASNYIAGDTNNDLINLYTVIKNDPLVFIEECKNIFTIENNTSEVFYEYRTKFNESTDVFERSVLFVYLNRHCFNGLCRYNKKGIFNVPFGRYKATHFPEKEILFASERLRDCKLYCDSFESTISCAQSGDVVYCDPPYVPLSTTSYFTDYSAGGFTNVHQKNLAELAEASKCLFLISNHDTEFTREIYKNADEIKTKEVSRFISANGSRTKAKEILAIYNKGN